MLIVLIWLAFYTYSLSADCTHTPNTKNRDYVCDMCSLASFSDAPMHQNTYSALDGYFINSVLYNYATPNYIFYVPSLHPKYYDTSHATVKLNSILTAKNLLPFSLLIVKVKQLNVKKLK